MDYVRLYSAINLRNAEPAIIQYFLQIIVILFWNNKQKVFLTL